MIHAVLGLSDTLAGVVLGWALATVSAVGTAVSSHVHRRRVASENRKAAARLILEELRVAQRAAEGDDPGLLAACKALPTSIWNQRREHLVDAEEWQPIADAFAAVDRLNAKREAHVIWRTEDTARELLAARNGIQEQLADADRALREIAS